MSLTAPERETVINFNDDEKIAYVYTAQRYMITKLNRNPAAVLVESGTHEGTAWARFEIPASLVSFRSGHVKRVLTDEQRKAAGDRLRNVRRRAVSV
jgi:hypothetical protein